MIARKLIFLTGAINCGKSTIGKKLLELCDNVAFVELDDLHNFVPWMPIERADINEDCDITPPSTPKASRCGR